MALECNEFINIPQKLFTPINSESAIIVLI